MTKPNGEQLTAKALAEFTLYFTENYPGPKTIISDPNWHAPKIFRAALRALEPLIADLQRQLAERRGLSWRCLVTGNLCGTDVRMAGDPCKCDNCAALEAYVQERVCRARKEDLDALTWDSSGITNQSWREGYDAGMNDASHILITVAANRDKVKATPAISGPQPEDFTDAGKAGEGKS